MDNHDKLYALKLFLDYFFEPWGAYKTAVWESLGADGSFTQHTAKHLCERILAGDADLINRIEKELAPHAQRS